MTDDLHALAAAVVRSPHWRWRPGVAWIARRPAPLEDVAGRIDRSSPYPGAIPDLQDPATLGCLLALYEEARLVRRCPDPVYTSAAVYGLSHPRTVAVLVAALLAAPAPLTQAEVP